MLVNILSSVFTAKSQFPANTHTYSMTVTRKKCIIARVATISTVASSTAIVLLQYTSSPALSCQRFDTLQQNLCARIQNWNHRPSIDYISHECDLDEFSKVNTWEFFRYVIWILEILAYWLSIKIYERWNLVNSPIPKSWNYQI